MIVSKLLTKAPDARYQSAYGLVYDLQHCLEVREERETEKEKRERERERGEKREEREEKRYQQRDG
jgi:hypothetical protein